MTDLTDLTDTVPLADLDRSIELPRGDDLALSRGTDFFHIGEQLDEHEREVLRRVREYCDTQVAPVANAYWERAEFPAPLVEGYRKLEVAGGTRVPHPHRAACCLIVAVGSLGCWRWWSCVERREDVSGMRRISCQ